MQKCELDLSQGGSDLSLPRFCGLEVGGKETPIFECRGSSVSHLLPPMPLEASLHHWALKAPLEAL